MPPLKIRASFKRTVQVKQYEPETIELAVEDEVNIAQTEVAQRKVAAARLVQEYFAALAQAGDVIVETRLKNAK